MLASSRHDIERGIDARMSLIDSCLMAPKRNIWHAGLGEAHDRCAPCCLSLVVIDELDQIPYIRIDRYCFQDASAQVQKSRYLRRHIEGWVGKKERMAYVIEVAVLQGHRVTKRTNTKLDSAHDSFLAGRYSFHRFGLE